jgi:DNA-binding transcriptional MerR regulator
MSPGQASKELGITRRQLRRLESEGRAHPALDGQGWRYYTPEEVERIRADVIGVSLRGHEEDHTPGVEALSDDLDDEDEAEAEEVSRVRFVVPEAVPQKADDDAELRDIKRRDMRIIMAAARFLGSMRIEDQGFWRSYMDSVRQKARQPSVAQKIDELDDIELIWMLSDWWPSGRYR